MSSESNRSAENLLLLCPFHASEVDDDENRFPAALLQQWRVAQREEFAAHQRAWPITDDEAIAVVADSFSSPTVNAPVLTAVARAAELLVVRAASTRSGPAAAAAQWRAMWEQTRASSFLWDEDGNRVFVEPSRNATDQHKASLLTALQHAHAELLPLVEALKAEVATARHVAPSTGPWCDWLTRSADDLAQASGAWPGPPPAEDDDSLDMVAAEVRQAAAGLAAALRGEHPEPPPAGPDDDENAQEPTGGGSGAEEALARHRELLERARPWSRVAHRPYDAALRNEIVAAAVDASTVPPVPSALPIGLWTTAGLAARIARNATESELAELVASDRSQRPLVVAVALLADLWRVLEEKNLSELAEQARDALLEELGLQDWSDGAAWLGNEVCGATMFDTWAHFTSAEVPKQALADALQAAPDRLDDVVLSCAAWVERISTIGGGTRFERVARELPDWYPAEAVLQAAAARYPHVGAATDDYDSGPADGVAEVEHLLGRIMRLATHESAAAKSEEDGTTP